MASGVWGIFQQKARHDGPGRVWGQDFFRGPAAGRAGSLWDAEGVNSKHNGMSWQGRGLVPKSGARCPLRYWRASEVVFSLLCHWARQEGVAGGSGRGRWRPTLWGHGGHFNPLLLGQEIKRFLLYFSKCPAASCSAWMTAVWAQVLFLA